MEEKSQIVEEKTPLSDFQVVSILTPEERVALENTDEENLNSLKRYHWYGIECIGGRENTILKSLVTRIIDDENDDFEQFLVCSKTKLVGDRGKERKTNDLPGAIFVKMNMNKESHKLVRWVQNVKHFAGEQRGVPDLRPMPITAKDMDRLLLKYLISTEKKKEEVKLDFGVGDYVEVVNGAFEGYTGKVESIDKGNVKISIEMLGRQVPSQVPAPYLKKKA